MFMGHYAAGLAAKAIDPRVPLWACLGAAELLDIAWSGAVMAGIERFRVDPSLPGAPLVLEYMPWTHSLPAAVLWGVLAGWIGARAMQLPRRAAVVLGLAVFSHWPLDLIVHRPDLGLWFSGPMLGFGLWNRPVVAEVVEMGALALASAAWLFTRGRQGLAATSALALLAVLVGMQLASVVVPAMPHPVQFGAFGLVVYLGIAGIRWLIDRGDRAQLTTKSSNSVR